MGRPKEPNARTDRIEVRLSPSERKQLESLAREAGMNLSEWARARLLGASR